MMEESKFDHEIHKVKVAEFVLVPPVIDFKKIFNTIRDNIKSPEEINASGVTGTVEVKYTIENDGTLTHFEVVKSLTPETDAEALRVVKLLPKYEPLNQQPGEPTTKRRSSIIPITFPYQSPFDK